MKVVSIIIPCYKSSNSLIEISRQINELLKKVDYTFELIFVNDSPHFLETRQTLRDLAKEFNFVKNLELRKNQGQQIAILVGLTQANGSLIITMDDDLQHPVEEITSLIKAMEEDNSVDAIFAIPPYSNKRHSLWRNMGSFILNKVDTFFLKKPEGVTKSAFKIFTSDIKEVLLHNYNAQPIISSLIIKSTAKIKNIQVSHNKRQYGKSNYGLKKLISLSLDSVLHYSSLPLRIIGIVGFISLVLSFLYIMFIIIKKIFFDINIPGFATTVILISFFGGLNLFSIGIVGEYLIRIIKEQHKPNLLELIKSKSGSY